MNSFPKQQAYEEFRSTYLLNHIDLQSNKKNYTECKWFWGFSGFVVGGVFFVVVVIWLGGLFCFAFWRKWYKPSLPEERWAKLIISIMK